MVSTESQAWRPNIASVHSQAVPEMATTGSQAWRNIASVHSQTVPKTEERGNQTKKKQWLILVQILGMLQYLI